MAEGTRGVIAVHDDSFEAERVSGAVLLRRHRLEPRSTSLEAFSLLNRRR
jgi:hypothetical protein